MTMKKSTHKPHPSLRTFEAQGVITHASIAKMTEKARASYIHDFMERSVELMRDKAAEEDKTILPLTLQKSAEMDPEGNWHFHFTARAQGKHRDRRSGRA